MRDQIIDIYHGQNENTIKETGQNLDYVKIFHENPTLLGMFCKATENTTFVDPQFEYNRVGMQEFPVKGFYHWARHGNIKAQADHVASTVQTLRDGEMFFLDLETTYIKGIPQPVVTKAEAVELADRLEQIFGRDVGMYFGKYFEDFVANLSYVLNGGRRPWFLPAYHLNDGTLDPTYEKNLLAPLTIKPTILQYTSQKKECKGITGSVDWNKVYDSATLYRCCNKPVPVPQFTTHLPKDVEMAKLIRVKENDAFDNAVFCVSGQTAVWVSTNAELQKISDLGLVASPVIDETNVQTVNREDLNVLILVSAAPSYPDTYSGPKTAVEDFRASA